MKAKVRLVGLISILPRGTHEQVCYGLKWGVEWASRNDAANHLPTTGDYALYPRATAHFTYKGEPSSKLDCRSTADESGPLNNRTLHSSEQFNQAPWT